MLFLVPRTFATTHLKHVVEEVYSTIATAQYTGGTGSYDAENWSGTGPSKTSLGQTW